MPRTYIVPFENVAVSAAQDLVQVVGATGKMLRILRAWWKCTDTTLPAAQQLQTRCKVMTATVTNGTGGTVPTLSKVDQGDAAASFTALANNTTKATTTGSSLVEETSGDYLYAGYDFLFPRPPTVGNAQSFVFELMSTPSATVHLSGGLMVEEMG